MKKLIIALMAALILTIGMLVGQVLPSEAQALEPVKQYTECAAVTMYVNAGKAVNSGRPIDRTIKVPAGWTPIGGTARGGEPTVLYCR